MMTAAATAARARSTAAIGPALLTKTATATAALTTASKQAAMAARTTQLVAKAAYTTKLIGTVVHTTTKLAGVAGYMTHPATAAAYATQVAAAGDKLIAKLAAGKAVTADDLAVRHMTAAEAQAEAEAAEAAAAYKAMMESSPMAYFTKLAAEVDLAAFRMAMADTGMTATDEMTAQVAMAAADTDAMAGDMTMAHATAARTNELGAMAAHMTPTGAAHITSTMTMADPAVATTGANIEEPTAAPAAAAAGTTIPAAGAGAVGPKMPTAAAAAKKMAMGSATTAAAAAPAGIRMQKLAAAAARNHMSKLKCVGMAGVATKVALARGGAWRGAPVWYGGVRVPLAAGPRAGTPVTGEPWAHAKRVSATVKGDASGTYCCDAWVAAPDGIAARRVSHTTPPPPPTPIGAGGSWLDNPRRLLDPRGYANVPGIGAGAGTVDAVAGLLAGGADARATWKAATEGAMAAFDAMLAAAFKSRDEARARSYAETMAEAGRVQALLRAQAEAGVQTIMSGAGAWGHNGSGGGLVGATANQCCHTHVPPPPPSAGTSTAPPPYAFGGKVGAATRAPGGGGGRVVAHTGWGGSGMGCRAWARAVSGVLDGKMTTAERMGLGGGGGDGGGFDFAGGMVMSGGGGGGASGGDGAVSVVCGVNGGGWRGSVLGGNDGIAARVDCASVGGGVGSATVARSPQFWGYDGTGGTGDGGGGGGVAIGAAVLGAIGMALADDSGVNTMSGCGGGGGSGSSGRGWDRGGKGGHAAAAAAAAARGGGSGSGSSAVATGRAVAAAHFTPDYTGDRSAGRGGGVAGGGFGGGASPDAFFPPATKPAATAGAAAAAVTATGAGTKRGRAEENGGGGSSRGKKRDAKRRDTRALAAVGLSAGATPAAAAFDGRRGYEGHFYDSDGDGDGASDDGSDRGGTSGDESDNSGSGSDGRGSDEDGSSDEVVGMDGSVAAAPERKVDWKEVHLSVDGRHFLRVKLPADITVPALLPGQLLETANDNGHFSHLLTPHDLGRVILNVIKDATTVQRGRTRGVPTVLWDSGASLQYLTDVVAKQPAVYVCADSAPRAEIGADAGVGGGGEAARMVVEAPAHGAPAHGTSTSPFAQAVRAICDGEVTVEKGNLVMPGEIKWPFANHPLLFVRAAYEPLYRNVLNELKKYAESTFDNQFPRRIVTGQPGIGKSVFAWYVIYQLLTETPRRSILYIYGANESIYIIDAESGTVTYVGSTKFNESAVFQQYSDRLEGGMVIVADSYVPILPDAKCSILVVSSPGRIALAKRANTDGWENYMARHGTPLYMPYPSAKEIAMLYEAAFVKDIPVKKFEGRLAFWGRIPRRLFAKRSNDSFYAKPAIDLDASIIFNAANYTYSGGTSQPAFDAPHRYIVQRSVGDVFDEEHAKSKKCLPFTEEYFQPAALTYFTSKAWYQLAMRKDAEKNWLMCESLSSALSDAAFVRSTMGGIFEARAKVLLARGGRFLVRNLHSGTEHKIFITRGEPQIFDSADTLGAILKTKHAGVPLVPLKDNFPAMDFICEVSGLGKKSTYVPMNMTIAKKHAINGTGLKEVAAALKWDDGLVLFKGGQIRTVRPFIFVIPAELYDAQEFWIAGSEQAVGSQYSTRKYGLLRQYVMRLDTKRIGTPRETMNTLFWKAADKWNLTGAYPQMPSRPVGAPFDAEDVIGGTVVPAARGGAGAAPGT